MASLARDHMGGEPREQLNSAGGDLRQNEDP